jgi:hypothetical protein
MYFKFYTKTDLMLNSLRKFFLFSWIVLMSAVYSYGQGATGLNFDGIDDYVTIPVKPELNIANAITIEAWIYPTKGGNNTQDIITKATSVNSGYILRTSKGWSNLVFRMRPNGGMFIELVVNYNLLNAWHHVAATYDGYKMKIYIDGVLMGQRDFAGQISVNNNPLTLGNQVGFPTFYGGSLDEVRIWNRALSQCEILNNMNCQLANTPSQQNGLAAYYKFNQGLLGLPNPLDTTITDSSPTGADGTLNNFGLLSGLLSNWVSGIINPNSTCTDQVAATVTAGSVKSLVPYSGTIELTSSGNGPGTYSWTGPNGFTSNEQNPTIVGAPLEASGTYMVTFTNEGGCSVTASTIVTVRLSASGLNFDGSNDQIVVPHSSSLNLNTFSVESWIYPTGGSTFVQNVVSKATRFDNTGFRFPKTNDQWSSFSFEMYINNEWKSLSYNFPTGALDTWNHVAATFDGYFMRIYLNGALVGTMEVAGTFSMNTNNLIIGNEQDRTEYFEGSLDELRIWSRALSQCEIINNMQTCELNGDNNALANQVGLAAYYRFNQGLVNADNANYTVLADSSGNGNNGVLQNFMLSGTASNWLEGKVNGLCLYFPIPTLTASANASVFQTGTTANLFAKNGNGTYHWDGPNGFTAQFTQNPVLTNVQPIQTGTYTVTNPYVNCVVTASTRIKISDAPQVIANGPTALCPSTTVTLSPATPGITYQWYKNDIVINGANGNQYIASQAGNYSVKITSGSDIIISAPIAVTEIIDTIAPVAAVAALPTLNIVAPGTVTSIPTAMDECRGRVNGTPNISLTFTRGGTYTIDWTYDDLNGNKSHQLQTVEVTDVIAPVITAPAPITVNGNAAVCGAVVNFAATATDDSEMPVTITYSQNPNTVFTVGNHNITITATDAFNNTATATFTITVLPTVVAPITGTNSVCVNATTTLATISTGGVWSSDNTNVITVNQSGVVTGVTAGTANIIYKNACGATASVLVTVKALPATPVVSVVNSCGSSLLNTVATGALLWNTGSQLSGITVTTPGVYTVTQTVNGCTSVAGSAVAAPLAAPSKPVVTVQNNCGSTTLSTDAAGALLWSTGERTSSITVSTGGTYSVTQTANGCESTAGTGVAAPRAIPNAPSVAVNNYCGNSVLTASGVSGASFSWNTGAATASITVPTAGTYTVTQTSNGCTSVAAGEGVAAPLAVPAQPVVSVNNGNCGNSTLSTTATGSLLWSTGAITSSIDVTTAGTYSVTQTVNGCTSQPGFGTANPVARPVQPVVSVQSDCGSSTLTVTNPVGVLTWSNGSHDVSITVTDNQTYTVTQSVNNCVSNPGSGTAQTKVIPAQPGILVQPDCGFVTLTAQNTTGTLAWSTGSSASSINVGEGSYSLKQIVDGCESAIKTVDVTPKAIPATPVISVENNCGSSVLTTATPGAGCTLLWNLNGATTPTTTVTSSGNYTVTITNSVGCTATSQQAVVTVKAFPNVAAITGASSVTTGSTIQLASATNGGVWSSNSSNATVNTTGLVTGVTVGTATISYSVTNPIGGCVTTQQKTITVSAPTCTTPVFTNTINNISVNTVAGCTATAIYSAEVSGTPVPVLNYTFSGATSGSGSGTGSGSVFNLGTTTVVITAANSCGTATAASFTVTVRDATAPTAIAKNITVALDASGQATVVPSQVDNGSYDNCGAVSLAFKNSTTTVTTGTICATANEGGILQLTAPSGAVITAINFASYGTPNGTCGSFTLGTANATNSKSIVEGYALGTNSVSIPATNAVFGDPVYGTAKRLYIQATYQIAVVSNTSNLSSLTFNCAKTGANTVVLNVTDANGNSSTQTATVTVVDNTAPAITAVANQTFCGAAGTYTVPAIAATDNCSVTSVIYQITGATSRSGTGVNASGLFNAGVSTITWTVKDASNNTSTSSATVTVGTAPVAAIAANSTTDFCGEFVLTASSSVSNASYKWMLGSAVLGTSQQLSLGQSSAEGAYQLYVTANGCTSAAASYSFQKQNMLSSYTILAYDDVKIGKYNKVATGSVGVMSSKGEAEFGSYSSVAGPNSFVKSPDIEAYGYGINISRQITGVVSIALPVMQYNTASAKNLSNYTVSAGSTVTLNSNYNNLKVKKGAYVTLNGNTFGTIDLEEGASVRFTNTTVNIDNLLVEDGAKDGYYSYVRFAPNTSVRVSAKVSIGSQVLINPDNNKVTFYMGDNKSDEEKFTVKGADTRVIANIYMPSGKLRVTSTDSDDDNHGSCDHKAHSSWYCAHRNHNHKDCDHRAHNAADCNDDVYMTGLFIVEDLESKGNTVIWNSFDCGSGSVPVVMASKPVTGIIAQATSEGKTVSSTVSTEEELKITVMPNPSTTYFTLKFESKYETPVNMRVMDASGRVVDTKSKIGANSTIQIGAGYASGTYYAEMTQGAQRKVVQLIKLRG